MPPKPTARQLELQRAYAEKILEKSSLKSQKSISDQKEIGCSLVRMGDKKVKVVEWHEKGKSVVVEVNGEVSRYSYPFKIYQPFINFEVISDNGYLDRFSDADEYIVGDESYLVKKDEVWAIGSVGYLGSDARNSFGSFREFLADKLFTKKKNFL